MEDREKQKPGTYARIKDFIPPILKKKKVIFLGEKYVQLFSTLSTSYKCLTGKYTTRKLHKSYIWDPSS